MVEKREMTPLAKWLWRELERRRESAREASLAAGLNHAAITRYLMGQRPTEPSVGKLAAYFEVPEDYLRELTGYRKPSPEHVQLAGQLAELLEDAPADEIETLFDLARSMHRRRATQR